MAKTVTKGMNGLFETARNAYERMDFKRAKELLDRIEEQEHDPHERAAAALLLARGYEDGHFAGGVDLDRAYAAFQRVDHVIGEERSDGLVGRARILFAKDGPLYRDEIVVFCRKAIDIDRNPRAMMLMGLAQEVLFHNEGLARRWYWFAFRNGLRWGLTFVARSHAREENHVRCLFYLILDSMLRPIFMFRSGQNSPFY